jgi:hypothetical protein
VRQAIEAELTTANQTREAYTAGLEQARVTTLATLAEVVPHLAGLPPAQFEQGLALLAQADPPAFQKTMDILGRVTRSRRPRIKRNSRKPMSSISSSRQP